MAALGIGVIGVSIILARIVMERSRNNLHRVGRVGADYNMLLISGIRDESAQHGIPSGVIRTVGSTGGCDHHRRGSSSPASMFGLLFGSIAGMVQTGFIIGAGLLLDTFLVRTITVPALAVLVGRANWWPILWGRPAPAPHRVEPAEPIPTPQAHETTPEPITIPDVTIVTPDIVTRIATDSLCAESEPMSWWGDLPGWCR